MGRQINFYMSASDQATMNAIIFADIPELIVLKSEMDKQELEFLDTTERIGKAGQHFMVLIARRNDITKIIVDPPLQVIVEPYHIRNIMNEELSPVVEYSRCISYPNEPTGNFIRRGRLYYHAAYYTENYTQKIAKDPDFIKFAQRLFGLFKKHLTYKRETGYYYGEGALRCEKDGWNLEM